MIAVFVVVADAVVVSQQAGLAVSYCVDTEGSCVVVAGPAAAAVGGVFGCLEVHLVAFEAVED